MSAQPTLYRGNRPHHIESVSGSKGVYIARTNSGAVYTLSPIDGMLPNPGTDLAQWNVNGRPAFKWEYQSRKRRSAKPVTRLVGREGNLTAEWLAASQARWDERNEAARVIAEAAKAGDEEAAPRVAVAVIGRKDAPRVSFIVKRGDIDPQTGALTWSIEDILEPKPRFTSKVFNTAVRRCKADWLHATQTGREVRFFIELRQGVASGRFIRQIDPLNTYAPARAYAAAKLAKAAKYRFEAESCGRAVQGVKAACLTVAKGAVQRARFARLSGQGATLES